MTAKACVVRVFEEKKTANDLDSDRQSWDGVAAACEASLDRRASAPDVDEITRPAPVCQRWRPGPEVVVLLPVRPSPIPA